MLNVEPIPAFDDNYIWLLSRAGHDGAFVVDPGDAAPVEQALSARGFALAGILITHHHFDHTGGIATLRERYGARVYGPDNSAIEGIDQVLRDGEHIDILDTRFDVITIPGHTLDHIAYIHRGEQPMTFCGDTLFAGGCGRVFEGTPEMMHQSLQRLAALPTETQVFCAHEYTLGNLAFAAAVEPNNPALQDRIASAQASRERGEPTVPSELSLELATNPFLRCAETSVAAGLAAQGMPAGERPVDVFAAVRGWKDNF